MEELDPEPKIRGNLGPEEIQPLYFSFQLKLFKLIYICQYYQVTGFSGFEGGTFSHVIVIVIFNITCSPIR